MIKNLLELSIEQLENVVAVAPYSHLHQMVLAVKKGNLHDATLHQYIPGSAVEAQNILQEMAFDSLSEIDKMKKEATTHAPEIIDLNILREHKKEVIKRKEKSTKPKVKTKKKKQKSKKIKDKSTLIDDAALSDFSKWLMAKGFTEGITPLKEDKKKKSKKKKKKTKSKDLTIGTDLISEPLAELMAKQGHYEKAIAMYEKLSLIFPEKSSFFAAQINKLRNNE